MKPLLPTLKEKKRYVAYEVISDERFSEQMVRTAVNQSLQSYLGALGVAKAGIRHLPERFNEKSQTGIIRVAHTSVDHLKAALTLTTQINNHEAIVQARLVSGTLKKAAQG